MKFTLHTDLGHGWLEVPISLLDRLGLLRDISKYSKLANTSVYLEADCDMDKFIYKASKTFNITPQEVEASFVEKYTVKSIVRTYAPYDPINAILISIQ